MLEILRFDDEPLGGVRYLNARREGGTEAEQLALERARVAALPDSLDALILTSDLQGIVPDYETSAAQLLGVRVADALLELILDGALPAAERTGVILAGDLYSLPGANKRGGFGDVEPVWAAFASSFSWVVGVAGNHDDVARVGATNAYVLDTEIAELPGLRIGGVGLITGDPDVPGRRAEEDQLERVALVAAERLDVLVVHEGPAGDQDQPGHPGLSVLVRSHGVPLTICGHTYWGRPLFRHEGGQVLNVNARVLVLTR